MRQVIKTLTVRERDGDRGYGMLGLAVSFALVGVLVMTASRAAFTDTTGNTGNVLGSGTVTLSDDDAASAMFAVSNMAPGDTVIRCIQVTYGGTINSPGQVRIYSGGYTDSATLGSYLNLTIEEGTGATFGDCSLFVASSTLEGGGTLAAFDATHTNYVSGAGTWVPATAPESRSYRITMQLDSATPNSEQGASVTGLTFTWEVST